MNQTNIFQNSHNLQNIPKQPPENTTFLVQNPQVPKIISSIPEHGLNFPFKVIQKEKEPNIPNNFLFLNNEKGAKSSSKNINIIKPKFVTKTIANEVTKMKSIEEAPSLNLSLNLSSSAFQPQIIKDNKEFRTKVNNKIFNLILDNKNDIFKLELHQIVEDVCLLKFFYENSFSLADLKLLNKFFCLFDNVADMMKELEKWLSQNQYTVLEDLDNKIAKIQVKVPILQLYENVELTLTQKAYSKENLFEILSKKVAIISKDNETRISKLEKENKFLLINLFHLTNSLNPMNMNYPMNQRENIRNINNINNLNENQNSNINRIINKGSNNNLKMKNNSYYNNKHSNFIIKKDKYSENDENNVNYEDLNENSNESNSNEDDNYFNSEKNKNNILNKKRGRGPKISSSSMKSNSGLIIKNNNSNNSSKEIEDINNENINSNSNNVIKNNLELNYYVLRDIKSKKINKVKGLYEIFQTPDELYMIVNKILYKFYKYKRNGNMTNYENKLSFCLINLFDSDINGDSAYAFHNNCDCKFSTISLIETSSGHRFGGYCYECFESPKEYFDKKDDLSFVFSLDKKKTYDVIRGKYAISCDKNYGPYFRDDHICIVDEFFTKESGTCIKGKGFCTSKNYELNSGKKYFTVKRLQVFQIKIKRIK